MLLLCYHCSRETKGKLEDENKTNTFFYVCLASLSDEKLKNKDKKAYFIMGLYNLIPFFFYLILLHLP